MKHNEQYQLALSEMRQGVLNNMKQFGFTPENIEIGTYALGDTGDENVLHFNLKEIKGWLFGAWFLLEEEKYNTITYSYKENQYILKFFAQEEHYIDKFKPSHSPYCIEEKYPSYGEFSEAGWTASDMLKEIKYHPFYAHCKPPYNNGYVRCKWLVLQYIKDEAQYYFNILKKWCKE